MIISFAILTYNSSKYVVETLESVKYQIERYRRDGYVYELVIADDASVDETLYVVNKWVETNSHLFNDFNLLKNDTNKGTVYNYHNIVRHLKGDIKLIIAGDDLFSHNDVVEIYNLLQSVDIVTCFPLCLEGEKLFIDKNRFYRFLYSKCCLKKNRQNYISRLIFGSFLHSPSTLFDFKMYGANEKQFVEKFKLYEDDPKWFKLLQKTDKLLFCMTPIIIYRYHNDSVCHGLVYNDFSKDRIKLMNYYEKYTKSIYLKVYLKIAKKSYRSTIAQKIYLGIRFIDLMKSYFCSYLISDGMKYEKNLDNELRKARIYYKTITVRANDFAKNIGITN